MNLIEMNVCWLFGWLVGGGDLVLFRRQFRFHCAHLQVNLEEKNIKKKRRQSQ